MTKINQIQEAIAKAERLESKLEPECFKIGGFTSPKIRHLMNNLGAISNIYLEIGCHRGATFVATGYKNTGHPRIAIDNFSEFDDGTVKNEFESNCNKFLEGKWDLHNKNCWEIDFYHDMFDLYNYDGEHSVESQKKAITHFLPAMKDEFIMCIDDASWDDVITGTAQGLAETSVQVLFDQLLVDGYWNGFRVLLLKKR